MRAGARGRGGARRRLMTLMLCAGRRSHLIAAGIDLAVGPVHHPVATARHFFEVCVERGVVEPLERLCALARESCRTHVDGALDVEVRMVDFDGEREVARA